MSFRPFRRRGPVQSAESTPPTDSRPSRGAASASGPVPSSGAASSGNAVSAASPAQRRRQFAQASAPASYSPATHAAGTAATRGAAASGTGGEKLAGLWSDALGGAATRALQVLLVVTLAGVAVWASLQLSLVVLPVLIALILASALWPLVRLLRRSMSPMLAAWTVFLGSMLILGGIGTGLFFAVRAEWPTLVDQAVEGFYQLQGMLQNLPFSISQQQIDEAVAAATDFLTSSQFGAGALSGLSAAGSFLTGLALLLVILFFFLKDGDRIWAFFLSWIPEERHNKWARSGVRTVETLGGYIRGTATIAAVDAVGIGVALLVLQVPLALPLAVIVFISSFIPMVGATFAGVLATLVALVANGPVVALIVLGVVVLVNQLEGNFLQPVVMAQALNLHALVILLALAAGTVLGGLVGAVLSVPLTAVVWSVVKIWTGREEREEQENEALEAVTRADAQEA